LGLGYIKLLEVRIDVIDHRLKSNDITTEERVMLQSYKHKTEEWLAMAKGK
jgi:hypothetical protein